MKIFVYKLLITSVTIFILFQITVGLLVKEAKKNIQVLSSKETAIQFKEKIREEIKNGLSKENILSKEDVVLLNQFYGKIKQELNSSN